MTVDIETRVRQANPLARAEQLEQLYGDDASRRLRSVIYARTEGRMTDTNQQRRAQRKDVKDSEPAVAPLTRGPRRRRGPAIALASFAVVIAIGVVIALVARGDGEPDVAEPPPPQVEAPVDVPDAASAVALGEQFVDAYLSFDPEALDVLAQPNAPLDQVRWLQGWAEAANYEVVVRHPCESDGTAVTCVLEGRDDWGDVLGLEFTDTFRIETVVDGKILGFSLTPGNGPEIVSDAFFSWIEGQHPELYESGAACDGFFSNGSTPGDCARAFITAAEEYVQANDT